MRWAQSFNRVLLGMASSVSAQEPDDERDCLGAIPVPMSGGDNQWLQFMANVAPVRAAYAATFGIVTTNLSKGDGKIHRSTMNSMLYLGLFGMEAATRVLAIKKMEEAKGIERDHKQLHGKETFIVYMSEEDKKSKIFKTLEETVEARAEAIGIPRSVLAKVDAAYRAKEEWEHAIKELHNEETVRSDQGAELPATLQVFHDLQARANKAKAQKEETDTTKLQELLTSAKVELDYIDKKVKELDDEIKKIPPKIEGLKKENAKLDCNIIQLASSDDEEKMAAAMRERRNNRDKISEHEGKKFVLNEAIEKCKKEKTELEETMKRIGEMIGGALPSAKKQRKTKA